LPENETIRGYAALLANERREIERASAMESRGVVSTSALELGMMSAPRYRRHGGYPHHRRTWQRPAGRRRGSSCAVSCFVAPSIIHRAHPTIFSATRRSTPSFSPTI